MKASRRTSVLSGHLCGGTAGLLTGEEIDRYHTDGFVVPENFCLPPSTIDLIKAQHAQLIQNYPKFTDYVSQRFAKASSTLLQDSLPLFAVSRPASIRSRVPEFRKRSSDSRDGRAAHRRGYCEWNIEI